MKILSKYTKKTFYFLMFGIRLWHPQNIYTLFYSGLPLLMFEGSFKFYKKPPFFKEPKIEHAIKT